jgi:hypothetical protein
MSRVAEIRKQMLGLSSAELAELRQFATLNMATGGSRSSAAEAKSEDIAVEFLHAIARTLQSRNLDYTQPGSMQKVQAFASYRSKLVNDGIADWLNAVVKKNRVARSGLLTLLASLLCDDLIEKGRPVHARAMMLHAHRIPAVLNRAFPGYAQFGMLHLIIRKEGT